MSGKGVKSDWYIILGLCGISVFVTNAIIFPLGLSLRDILKNDI